MSSILENTALSAILPVILSGGSGSRLWPLSRKEHPKQLLNIVGDKTLLQQTALRFRSDLYAQNPLIVCNQLHQAAIQTQLQDVGVTPQALLIEPHARGTAAAMTAVAAYAAHNNPDAVLLIVPSDHVIENGEAFNLAVSHALPAAANGAIVTFGATPHAPETGFGYILRGDPYAAAPGCYDVKQFLEKPNQIAAAYYVQEGTYFWNCGIFLAHADTILSEMQRWRPDIAMAASACVTKAKTNQNLVVLDGQSLAEAQTESFDKAVMEHTARAAIIPVDMGWSDVGSWDAVWQAIEKDNGGNAVTGTADAQFADSRNCYVHSDAQKIVTLGVEDLVVIATHDTVMVMKRDRAQDVRQVAK